MIILETVKDRRTTIEELHRRFGGVIFDHCLRMMGEIGEAEDAVQETFVSAYRSLSSFRYGDTHLPWLYRIATNACLKAMRTRKRREVRLADVSWGSQGDADDAIKQLHIRRKLEDLAGELDQRSMEILVAHCVSRMNQSEIAEFLGISRRAVVKRLTAIRRRASELFEEDNHD